MTWEPFGMLAGGGALMLLLAGYLGAFLRRSGRIERLARERAAQLAEANRQPQQEIEERRRAQELLSRNLERQVGLNRLLQDELPAAQTLDEKLKKITDAVVDLFDADFCRIWVTSPGDRCDSGCMHARVTEGPHVCRQRDLCLHLLASSGRYTHVDGEVHRRVPFGCYKIGRVAAGDDPKFLTNDVQHDPRVHDHAWAGELGLVSFAGYRLCACDGTRMGVLALFAKHPISREEDQLLEGLASSTSHLIQAARAKEQLTKACGELEARVEERTRELATANALLQAELIERRRTEETLEAGRRCEAAVAKCSRELVTGDNLDESLQSALGHLMAGAGASRVYLFENFSDPQDGLCVRQTHEVCAPGVHPEINDPLMQHLPYAHGFADWPEKLARGEAICGLTEEFPPPQRDMLRAEDILSILVIPVFVGGVWYGFVGFDNTREARPWSGDAVRLLRTGAEMIGAAIERKRTEQLAAQRETELLALLDNLPDMAWLKDSESRFILVNRAFAEAGGCLAEGLRGKTDYEVWPRELAERYRADDREVMRRGQPKRVDEPLVGSDGRTRIIETIKAPIRDAEGNITGTVGIARDITDRRQAEQEIKALKWQMEFVLGQTKTGLDIIDSDFNVRYVDPHWQRVYGDPTGRKCYEYFMDRTEVCPGCGLVKALQTKCSAVSEEVLVKENNRPVQVTTVPFQNEKGEWLVAEVNVDISERKRAEQELRASETRFRAITETAQDAIITADSQGRIRTWNSAAERIFGYTAAEMIGQDLLARIVPPQYRAAKAKGFAEFVRTGSGPVIGKTLELSALRKDGTEFPIEISVSAYQDQQGYVAVGLVRDITARKRLETQLSQAQKLESIGQLAAGIAHEINTPTQFVGDNTRFLQDAFKDVCALLDKYNDLLRAEREGRVTPTLVAEVEAAMQAAELDYLSTEIPKAIEQSLEGIQRVTTIVRAMKDFSHPACDEYTAIDLNRAIESTIAVARNEWKYVAEVETHFDRDLPPVPCLPGDINQAVLNVLVNAPHAIAEVVGKESGRKGKITVTTRHDGDWAEIRIADTGPGIPENIQSRIFDPFFTTKKIGKGTGQGLAIAHAVIARKHKGTITFETSPGVGTTFIIRLPLDGNRSPEGEAGVQATSADRR